MHLKHRRRHIGCGFAVNKLMYYLRFFLAEGNENDIFRAAYGFKPHSNAHTRHIFNAAEVLCLHFLCAVGELLNMGVRIKQRCRLIKADMSVKPYAENDEVKTAVRLDLLIVAMRLKL